MAIKLRDYQKRQFQFIEDRIDLTNVIGIESPTGSGKTFTILEYAKHWLEKEENHLSNVVITTGFNNLVFLMEKRAKEAGFDNVKVLIGTKACNCPVLMKEAGKEFKLFSEEDDFICGDKHKHLDNSTSLWNQKFCPFTKDAYYEYYKNIINSVGQIIIMNHSSFLIHQDALTNVSLVIVDEAHTFDSFYESYVRLELDKEDLEKIDEAINNIKPPLNKIIKMNIERKVPLPSVQIDKICENINEYDLARRAREFFETKQSNNNYIEITQDTFIIDRFYRSFEFKIRPKFILFSATLDKFTRMMFNCYDLYYYKETKNFCDFSKSEFIAIPDEDFEKALIKFLNYVNNKRLKSGLCLSTTIHDMNLAFKHDGYLNYKMFNADQIKEFEQYKGKKILVGSRRLFQGIDIHGLEFICLNKLPFPNWNDKTRAMRDYITNNGKNNIDFWKDYSVPKTENDIIQTTGRLWRNEDSKGIVSIFDPRIIQHKYMIRYTMENYRKGIKINIMDENGNVRPFDVSKIEEKDTRKDIRKDDRSPNFI